ncbi:hypothetical protein K474DRAFT_1681365 [Panus rudis PR-1116 ss-1]|nr:hypothetical protein K474DRAFT_1681365 [Panus rudis PR-1116 ss-1]
MAEKAEFNPSAVLRYLCLPQDYTPSPETSPVEFLSKHIRSLPPDMLAQFSSVTTPKERTTIPIIRNRRLKYVESNPPELNFADAKVTWPLLWSGKEPIGSIGVEEAKEEREWAEKEFLKGKEKHVGKLGNLLGIFEEEREAERARAIRRRKAQIEEDYPEEDEDTDEEDDADLPVTPAINDEEETPEAEKATFLRRVKERLIYGQLDPFDYDKVDWNDTWDDIIDRDEEERWFDSEEESAAMSDGPA